MLVALTAAGFSLCAFVAALALARPADTGGPRLWLGLVFLEQAFVNGAGLSESLGGPDLLTAMGAALDGLYGLPALYLFARAVLADPHPAPWAHFLPAAVCALGAAILAAAYALGGTTWVGEAFWLLEGLSWLAETVQFAVYGLLILRRLKEPRRPSPGLAQARPLARLALFWYAIMFAGSWALFALEAMVQLDWAVVDYPLTVASYAIILPLIALAAYWLAAKPWLLFDLPLPEAQSAAAGTLEAGVGSASGKYARTPLGPDEAQRLLSRARAYLKKLPDLSEEFASPKKLADGLGVPYHRLSRASNEAGRLSLPLLITEARLDRAEGLLAGDAELSILDIAFEAGFAAKSSFNEAWRRRHRESPRLWRQDRVSRPL